MEDDIEIEDWPDCAIENCPNKCCLALNSIYCFPHTLGNKHVKSMKIDALHPEPLDEMERNYVEASR